MSTNERRLDDTTVAVLIAPEGTEEIEFTESRRAVAEAGATGDVVGSETGEAETATTTWRKARRSRSITRSPTSPRTTTMPS
jgi:protease I